MFVLTAIRKIKISIGLNSIWKFVRWLPINKRSKGRKKQLKSKENQGLKFVGIAANSFPISISFISMLTIAQRKIRSKKKKWLARNHLSNREASLMVGSSVHVVDELSGLLNICMIIFMMNAYETQKTLTKSSSSLKIKAFMLTKTTKEDYYLIQNGTKMIQWSNKKKGQRPKKRKAMNK